MAKSKINTADGSKGNGGLHPHTGKKPTAKKGAARIMPGGHKMAAGANSTTC